MNDELKRKRIVGGKSVTVLLTLLFAVPILYFATAGFVVGFLVRYATFTAFWKTFYVPVQWLVDAWAPYRNYVWWSLRAMGPEI